MHVSAKQTPIEKREFQRNKCRVNVEYSHDLETHHKAVISDITQAGAFIDTHKILNIGQDMLMKIHLPGLPKPMAVMGKIIRHSDKGMGVKFNMAFGVSAINSFIKSNTARIKLNGNI